MSLTAFPVVWMSDRLLLGRRGDRFELIFVNLSRFNPHLSHRFKQRFIGGGFNFSLGSEYLQLQLSTAVADVSIGGVTDVINSCREIINYTD